MIWIVLPYLVFLHLIISCIHEHLYFWTESIIFKWLQKLKNKAKTFKLKFFSIDCPQEASDEYLDEMMNQAPGAINFTMFLTLFGERLQGTDPEDVIKNAFACFDETNAGKTIISIIS